MSTTTNAKIHNFFTSPIYSKYKFRLALFQELYTAGTWLGWSPMVLMFLDQGVYADLCTNQPPPCAPQRAELAQIFTITVSFVLASSYPVGLFTDKFGPRIMATIGFILSTIGGILLTYTVSNNLDNLILYSFLCIGFGNLCCHIPIFKIIGNLPIKERPLSNTLVTTAFNLSPLYFQLIYLLIVIGGLTFSGAMLFQIIPSFLAIFTVQWIYYTYERPRKFPNSPPETETEMKDTLASVSSGSTELEQDDQTESSLLEYWAILPLKKQILTRPFLEISLYMSIHSLRRAYFLAILEPYFSSLAPLAESRPFIVFAGYAPLFSVFAIPLFTFALNRLGVYKFWHFNNFSNFLYGLFCLIPSLWTQAIALIIFSITNSQMFGIFFHNLGHLYGYQKIGQTSGIASLINGIFGLISIPLVYLSIETWESYWELNLVLMVCACFIFIPLMKWAKLIKVE